MKKKKMASILCTFFTSLLFFPSSFAWNEKITYDENQLTNDLNARMYISHSLNATSSAVEYHSDSISYARTIYAYTYPIVFGDNGICTLLKNLSLKLNDAIHTRSLSDDSADEFKLLTLNFIKSIGYRVATKDIAANLYCEAMAKLHEKDKDKYENLIKRFSILFKFKILEQDKDKDYINTLNVIIMLIQQLDDPSTYMDKNTMLIAVDESHRYGFSQEYIYPSVHFEKFNKLNCDPNTLREILHERESDKISSLSGDVKFLWDTTTENLSKQNDINFMFSREISDLKKQIAKHEERLNHHDESIKDLQKRLSKVESLSEGVNKNIDYLNNIEFRVNNSHSESDKNAIEKMIKNFVYMESRKTEAYITALREYINNVASQSQSNFKKLSDCILNTESEKKDFQRLVAEFREFIDTYNNNIDILKNEIQSNVSTTVNADRIKALRSNFEKAGWFGKMIIKLTHKDIKF